MINKRNVTLTSGSASKTYDGKPLTNSNVTASGDGFVGEEGATYNVTGSQTEVGSSTNIFTYSFNPGTTETNYQITKVEGILTVNKRNIIPIYYDPDVEEKKEEPVQEGPSPATKLTTAEIKSIVDSLQPCARSMYVEMNGKRVVQLQANFLDGDEGLRKLIDNGCTIKYVFYRSSKKSSDYKKMLTSKTGQYTNTMGKSGKRYFYKVVIKVFDENGELAASTRLKNCKYATRVY